MDTVILQFTSNNPATLSSLATDFKIKYDYDGPDVDQGNLGVYVRHHFLEHRYYLMVIYNFSPKFLTEIYYECKTHMNFVF